MSKKTPSTKKTKKTVTKTIKDVAKKSAADPAVILAARNKYRKSPKFPKARTAGR